MQKEQPLNLLTGCPDRTRQAAENLLGIPYNRLIGPDDLYIIDPHLMGINCQATVHWLYRAALGVYLPPGLLSREILNGSKLFDPVEWTDGNLASVVKVHDMVILQPKKTRLGDDRDGHLATVVGFNPFSNEPVLFHGCFHEGVCLWSLSQFTDPRSPYEKILGVRRLKNSVVGE